MIKDIVDEVEDGAPLGVVCNLSESVQSIPSNDGDESELEEDEVGEDDQAVFNEAETALYNDWSERDTLLK